MSRAYEMTATISGYDPLRAAAIKAAAADAWPFEHWIESAEGEELVASAESQLCGGESEEEFAERLSVTIWRANGAFCEVVVDATYLELLPYETHCLDQSDYDRLIEGKNASGGGAENPDCTCGGH